ncbi:hypothetical protein FOA52_005182 [Chlamydomonas sp. UWO 241]|nr:hypothetical protein FOA52_005182 [Chlamydomonas sp. UWO 241]
MAPATGDDTFFLASFAQRQWDDPKYSGTRMSIDKQEFLDRVHELWKAQGGQLADGYAPFCKHLFVPNFVTGATVGALEITDANRALLHSGYSRRRPEELAVLSRSFWASEVSAPPTKFLDLILYSREQIMKEAEAMPAAVRTRPEDLPTAPWGIISIKAQDESYETPMQPITILRNSLGRSEGGSGVPIDRAAYEEPESFPLQLHQIGAESAGQVLDRAC